MARRIAAGWLKLGAEQQGLALLEFAFAFPLLLTLYLGTFTYSDAFACSRKVTATARVLADLATRYPSLSSSDVTTVLNASAQVLAPYGSSHASIVLSEVRVTSSTQATIVWSRTRNGTARTSNSSIKIPSGLASTGTYLVLGEVSYAYRPNLPIDDAGTITLADRIFMLPRVSDSVPLS